ncbi:MAG: hypothetical protein AAGK17_10595 [Pseudomonadota bacterium]
MLWDINKLLGTSLMTRGIFRTRNGWANDDSVCVRYPDGKELEIPRIQYEALINNPPFESLPWEADFAEETDKRASNS